MTKIHCFEPEALAWIIHPFQRKLRKPQFENNLDHFREKQSAFVLVLVLSEAVLVLGSNSVQSSTSTSTAASG